MIHFSSRFPWDWPLMGQPKPLLGHSPGPQLPGENFCWEALTT